MRRRERGDAPGQSRHELCETHVEHQHQSQRASTQPLPSGLTLGNMPDATASVTFDADQSGLVLIFCFRSPTLQIIGQGAAGDRF